MDTLRLVDPKTETMANPNVPMPMIQDQNGAQALAQPGALLALPPVPGGDVGDGQRGFGPTTLAKRTKRGVGRSMSFSPSHHGRAKALANERSALPLQYATMDPTGGAATSFGPGPSGSNPIVGFWAPGILF